MFVAKIFIKPFLRKLLSARSLLGTSGLFSLERRVTMYKAGTVAELESLELAEKLPGEVFQEVLRVVEYLDNTFGADREVDYDDGGYVFIAEDITDLKYFDQHCVELNSPTLEYVEFVPSEEETYLNAFYLVNEYESGITLFAPISIAPESLLSEVKAGTVHR
jgi:hypothetical protein